VDGEPVATGRITIAPPDRHLLLDRGSLRLVRGPREGHHRPAIDPLFRSAASSYGSRVVAVVLSGLLRDGSAGLAAVKAAGGFTIVQDPDDALYSDMPRNALRSVAVDEVCPASEIAALLTRRPRRRPASADPGY
jgi:two-component system, chemotaxis family, protein-glutamate methylesterase/glutaminase